MHDRRCPHCGAWSYRYLYVEGCLIPANIAGCDLCLTDEISDDLYPSEEWEIDWGYDEAWSFLQ